MAIQGNTQRPGSGSPLRRAAQRLFEGYNRDQKLFIAESMLINSANVITTGVFLTGLLVMMHASNLMVGLVTSSGTWSLMLSLASSVVVERMRRKKALLTWVLAAFRLLTTLPVFLPAFLGFGLPSAAAAAAMMVAGNAVFSLFNTGFPVFFMASLPREGRGAYIYNRMMYLRIAYTVTSVAGGLLLDMLHKSYLGFIIVFSLGLAIGIADVIVFTMIKGEPGEESQAVSGIAKRLFEPFTKGKYLRFLVFTFVYFLFFSLASSYTSLYQVKYLNLSYAFITAYNTCIYVLMIFMTRIWARREEKRGSISVLVLTSFLLPMDFLVYSFLTTSTLWLLPFSVLFNGLASSGLWACIMPYRYSLMPEEGRTVYEGWYGFIYGAANLMGAFAGGYLQKLLPEIHTSFMTFSVFQLIYLAAGLLSIATVLVFWLKARKD